MAVTDSSGTHPAALHTEGSRLDVRGLRKTYETRSRSVEAVRDLTFSIDAGALVCIVGPSGAGKTTLLKCIAGLLEPSGGEVLLAGKGIHGPTPGMAVVFQDYGRSLFPWMTVRDNIELPLREKKLPRARRHELVTESLDAVGLADAGSAYPWQLSGGMQQRVAIARAVAYEPHLMLMDEPFAAVDAQTRADLEDLIRSLWARLGVTIVFITHDIDEAVYLGERVLVLSMSPSVIQADVTVDLPATRDQLTTRATPEFAKYRAEVYSLIQQAKQGRAGSAAAMPEQ